MPSARLLAPNSYMLELFRFAPIDVNFLDAKDPYADTHRSCTVRREVVRSFVSHRKSKAVMAIQRARIIKAAAAASEGKDAAAAAAGGAGDGDKDTADAAGAEGAAATEAGDGATATETPGAAAEDKADDKADTNTKKKGEKQQEFNAKDVDEAEAQAKAEVEAANGIRFNVNAFTQFGKDQSTRVSGSPMPAFSSLALTRCRAGCAAGGG